MSLRLSNLRLPVGHPDEELPKAAAKALGISTGEWLRWRILKKSIDARSSSDLQFVYSLLIDPPGDGPKPRKPIPPQGLVTRLGVRIDPFVPGSFQDATPGKTPTDKRPVVIGSGPAGLLAAYYLALKGYRPIILERGKEVKDRVSAVREFDRGGEFDRENNYLFGEGGAGCFSDGKLTCRLEGPDVDWVLERFVDCGGRPSISYENRPHLGSNKLPLICRNFRRKIESLGGEYRFGCRFDRLEFDADGLSGVATSTGTISTRHVFLGIGHSARDTYAVLHQQGVPIVQKAFQLGIRIEQPQEQINRHKYGRSEYLSILGPADYTLNVRGPKDVFTFCMCAGGIIIPSISEPEMFCSNGMSNSRHDTPFANSGIVVTLEPTEFGSDHPLAGVQVQQKYEAAAYRIGQRDYLCPIQRGYDFVAGKPADPASQFDCSYQRGTRGAMLDEVLPPVIAAALRHGLPAMDQKFRGEFLKNANLVGPEMRGSSPVRIERDLQSRQCPNIPGLYPIGEGAGYAGGIVSAAVDGLRSAREMVCQFAQPTAID